MTIRISEAALSARKEPKQSRSGELVASIVEAAAQVLARDGAARFTTSRVAERAGVSIGSLYQYFPNKAALLFRLQSDEWRTTAELLRSVLQDESVAPLVRLRRLVLLFVRSECEEAELRGALREVAPRYRDAPEARAAHASAEGTMLVFLREALPGVAEEPLGSAADLIKSTMRLVGKSVSERGLGEEEIERYAGGLADMLCAYVRSLGGG